MARNRQHGPPNGPDLSNPVDIQEVRGDVFTRRIAVVLIAVLVVGAAAVTGYMYIIGMEVPPALTLFLGAALVNIAGFLTGETRGRSLERGNERLEDKMDRLNETARISVEEARRQRGGERRYD